MLEGILAPFVEWLSPQLLLGSLARRFDVLRALTSQEAILVHNGSQDHVVNGGTTRVNTHNAHSCGSDLARNG